MAILERELSGRRDDTIVVDRRYRLTTEQYYRMGEAGVFGDDKRIELIDGEVVKLEPIGPMHSRRGQRLYRSLLDALRNAEFFVVYEEPITVIDGTEPQPDLAVAIGPESKYDDIHPRVEDLALVVEVSASSLASDRKRKLGLYASAGIPEFWIVNLPDKQVEVYTDPADSTYMQTTIYKAGDELPLRFAPGNSLSVADFLPNSK